LIQFVSRLAFGLSLAMAVTPPAKVPSGFYRNHLYVVMGLFVVGALAAWQSRLPSGLWLSVGGAALAYAGAVVWMYEKARLGRAILVVLAALGVAAALLGLPSGNSAGWGTVLRIVDPPLGGAVLGVTLAAMLLGHYYLNVASMDLLPIRRLVGGMGAAIGMRAVAAAAGLLAGWSAGDPAVLGEWPLLSLRWLAGLVGGLATCVMAWKTLNVPNTQSATGILYVGVIVTFLGELVSLFLSRATHYPV
jgi:hypothetical protein